MYLIAERNQKGDYVFWTRDEDPLEMDLEEAIERLTERMVDKGANVDVMLLKRIPFQKIVNAKITIIGEEAEND